MRISIGTRSLLFGAHYPPHILMVAAAWKWLYGSWPTWREMIAICLHDVGYFGCKEMDGPDGTMHPELGASIATRLLGQEYGNLIRGHSKGYSECFDPQLPLSKLYGADKLSRAFEPLWWYAWRCRLTGEIAQYRSVSHGCTPRKDSPNTSDREWFRIIRMRMVRGGCDETIKMEAPNGLGEHRGR